MGEKGVWEDEMPSYSLILWKLNGILCLLPKIKTFCDCQCVGNVLLSPSEMKSTWIIKAVMFFSWLGLIVLNYGSLNRESGLRKNVNDM